VELGIPFSDPLADGVTIQKSSFHALQNGVTPQLCLEVAGQLSPKVDIPLVFMTYFNPVFSYGLEEFSTACAGSGIQGLIIPDLPPEEGRELEAISQRRGLDLIYLLAPTSTEERIKLVAERSRGFIYLVSVTGVTGVRDRIPANLAAFVTRVRNVATQPLCIGFGISTPQQAGQIARIADGVIVGSRIIQLMEMEDGFTSLAGLVKGLRNSIDKLSESEKAHLG
jgi:tryptophan synthase alpha chain